MNRLFKRLEKLERGEMTKRYNMAELLKAERDTMMSYGEYSEGQEQEAAKEAKMRTFDTGATRSADSGKLDFEGFLCPWVLERYAQYLHEHRTQADGQQRTADNWQKGIPKKEYTRSLWRHFIDFLKCVRGAIRSRKEQQDFICGIIFNAMGWLHEDLKESRKNTTLLKSHEPRPQHLIVPPGKPIRGEDYR